MKYALDKILSALLLLVLSPILALKTLAIMVEDIVSPRSRGPIIIMDECISEGRTFRMLEFRSHFVDEDALHACKKRHTKFIND